MAPHGDQASNLLAQEAEGKSYLHELKLDFKKKIVMLCRPYKCILKVVWLWLFTGFFVCFLDEIPANTVTATLKKLAETCFTNHSIKPI